MAERETVEKVKDKRAHKAKIELKLDESHMKPPTRSQVEWSSTLKMRVPF